MPHRTVFQIGKNHVHPFTMFLGGVVVGSIATGTIAWTWANAGDDVLIQDSVTPRQSTIVETDSPEPLPSLQPSASPAVTF